MSWLQHHDIRREVPALMREAAEMREAHLDQVLGIASDTMLTEDLHCDARERRIPFRGSLIEVAAAGEEDFTSHRSANSAARDGASRRAEATWEATQE